MRRLLPIAATALALAACHKADTAASNRSAGAAMTAEDIVSNDVTAIDAVTADAANMAADVNYADALAELGNNQAEPRTAAPKAKAKAARPAASETPAPTPAETSTNAE